MKQPALRWMRQPTSIPSAHSVALSEVPGLDERLKASLHALDVSSLFGVQSAVWQHTGGGLKFDRDLCVCAPTGSGKTLAYALPLVQGLAGQKTTTRLRALVVVPTGDLAFQVARVFEPLCRAVGLKVGVNHGSGRRRPNAAAAETVFEAAFDDGSASAHDQLDVLVTPPGRLVAYLRETQPGFSLARLQYLVVDEADRILRQSYQNWTPQVVAAAGARRPRTAIGELGASRHRLKKILISATLTRDPARLAGLFLHAPRMLAATADGASPSPPARYLLPEGLTEAVVPVPSGDAKPLALRALLRRTGDTPVIVFTASVEATHRLFLLLSSMDAAERSRDERDERDGAKRKSTKTPSRGFRLAEYSSFAPQAARAEALRAFAAGDARVLIASDAATRGLDVDRVGAVVSYDAPTHLKTYVHRVGRTARAGLRGVAYTLCRPAEEAPFLAMTSKADLRKRRAPPSRLALADEEMDEHRSALRAALVAVKLHLEADATGVAAEEGRVGSTAAARVAAAQACQNHLRSCAPRLHGERRDVESRRVI